MESIRQVKQQTPPDEASLPGFSAGAKEHLSVFKIRGNGVFRCGFPPCVVGRHIDGLPSANLLHGGNGCPLAYKIDSDPNSRGLPAEATLDTGRLTCRRDAVANAPGCHRKDAFAFLHIGGADQV